MSLFRSTIIMVLPLLFAGPAPTDERQIQIDKMVHRAMKKHHLPGFAITIVEDQNIVYHQAEGYIDLENKLAASTHSLFKLFSVSKVFTAIEIWKETEEGLVDLDHPLSDYLPHFGIQNDYGDLRDITIKSMLAHRSGLPRNECLRVPAGEEDTGTLDRFEIGTWDCHLSFPPAYRYKYSNLGYDLLGRVIEENRSMAYAPYMKSLLRDSLGMKNSTFDDQDIKDPELRVKGYEYHRGKWFPRIQTNINSLPSGNLYASLNDLANFFKTVFRAGVFKEESTLYRMFEDHYSRPEDPETMGLGWKTTRLNNDELLVWHDGGPSEGIGSLIALLPERKIGIAMVANSTEFSGAISIQLAIKILDEMLTRGSGSLEAPDVIPQKALLNKENLEAHEGSYMAFGKEMQIKRKNRKLKGRIGVIGFNLIPLNETDFRITNWMDQIGLTKLIRTPLDFNKIKVSFTSDSLKKEEQMIINMSGLSYEICPSYPDQIQLPAPMEDLPGSYRLAWRLPYNQAGPLSGDVFSISLDKELLKMSGIFGPILPRNNHQLSILCGPFAGEIMDYDEKTGHILHQNAVFLPSQ